MEAQHRVSTTKLTDGPAQQVLLEELLEEAKPPAPGRRHYLIEAPFRYPPLRYGSRFGRASERGLFYASREVITALTETAYYRLLFVAGSDASLTPLTSQHTLFRAAYDTGRGIDLTRPPFATHAEALTARDDYAATQALGSAMRADGVGAFRFASARRVGGLNVGVFNPAAIKSAQPMERQGWTLVTDVAGVAAVDTGLGNPNRHFFPRRHFEVDGRLPAPAL